MRAFFGFRQTKQVVGPQGADLQGLYGNSQIVNGASGRRKMQDVIQLSRHMHKGTDIVVVKLKLRELKQMGEVVHIARDQVVHADDMVAFLDKAVAQMRAQKSGGAGDEYTFHK